MKPESSLLYSQDLIKSRVLKIHFNIILPAQQANNRRN